MTESVDYRAEFSIEDFVDKYVERVNREIDQRVLDKVEHRLAEYGYVKVVRCRDCKFCMAYMAGAYCDYMAHAVEPDGFCSWGERKKVDA